jgi:hypothetical protein
VDQEWPDAHIAYDWPRHDDANRERWQAALDAALRSRTLRWEATGDPAIVVLSGACPRCGHETSQQVRREPTRGDEGEPGLDPTHVHFNFDCMCSHPHSGSDGVDTTGCGWGGPVAVRAVIPSVGGG